MRTKPSAIIVDLDGVLVDNKERAGLEMKPADWDALYARSIPSDKENKALKRLLWRLNIGFDDDGITTEGGHLTTLFITGRHEKHREATEAQLKRMGCPCGITSFICVPVGIRFLITRSRYDTQSGLCVSTTYYALLTTTRPCATTTRTSTRPGRVHTHAGC